MLHFWPIALTSVAECYVSIKRIEQFLLLPEKKSWINHDEKNDTNEKFTFFNKTIMDMGKDHINVSFVPDVLHNINFEPKLKRPIVCINENALDKCIRFNNVTAMWGKEKDELQTGVEGIDLDVKSNQMCAIIGPVGSGKSTILQTILREIEIDKGELTINGVISYAAQEPWLFEGTVRENILFTENYEEKRYKEVIRVCALERDLQLLPYGDYTIIGERGISLSGGQRARVNLARTVYRQADIYLLDDPLSAVDTLVGKHIFDHCIKKFLKDKICILVTHQVQYLKNVSHVVLLNSGKIEIQGSYVDIQQSHYNSLRRMSSAKAENKSKKPADIEIQVN